MGDELSIYLSLPFCLHKCSYCDLNAYAGLNDLIPAYIDALIDEIRLIGRGADWPVHTVYFGGGTPSFTPPELLARLFAALRDSFRLTPDCEISLEANPETLTADYLAALKGLGVNRLSLGAQSAQANELALFQRTHTFGAVITAVSGARRAGFDNLGLDLIYGIPGQTLQHWQDTLAKSLALDPEHFSLYVLSLDFNTPMRAWVQRGLLPEPSDDLAAEMYAWAGSLLESAGYEQYEISNWAKGKNPNFQNPKNPISNNPITNNSKTNNQVTSNHVTNHQLPITQYQCRHNLQYWRNQPYFGLGAGAHGYWGGARYSNVGNPPAYVRRMKTAVEKPFPFSPALNESISIDRETEMNETMLTGLRLVHEGVRESDFQARFGIGLKETYGDELAELQDRGLIAWDESGVRLAESGRFVSNWVFERFV